MIWITLLIIGFSLLLIKLGAVSVWVTVFSQMLKVAVFVIAGFSIVFLWKWYRKS
jgi:hypothetical protein